MKLYHGSNMAIDEIDLSKGRWGKDFGRGFYLSADETQAYRMAELTTFRRSEGIPVVTAYEIADEVFSSNLLKVKHFDGYSEDWAKFIVQNRRNDTGVQAHDYDIVIGPIANDKVGVQMRLFVEEYIDVVELVRRLTYVRPTIQYFFATPLALQYLRKL